MSSRDSSRTSHSSNNSVSSNNSNYSSTSQDRRRREFKRRERNKSPYFKQERKIFGKKKYDKKDKKGKGQTKYGDMCAKCGSRSHSSKLCSLFPFSKERCKIVTALAKPNPSWSQIRLGLELSNASEPTPPHHTPPHPTHHRNSKQPISQPFLNGLSWNFACWLPRWLGWSLESKQWPCSTAVFHAALQNL